MLELILSGRGTQHLLAEGMRSDSSPSVGSAVPSRASTLARGGIHVCSCTLVRALFLDAHALDGATSDGATSEGECLFWLCGAEVFFVAVGLLSSQELNGEDLQPEVSCLPALRCQAATRARRPRVAVSRDGDGSGSSAAERLFSTSFSDTALRTR